MPDHVCIVGGTGALGFGLALRLGQTGTPVVIGSRDAERARGGGARRPPSGCREGDFNGLENAEAVKGAEIVVLSVPFRSQSETLTNLKEALSPEQLVVDATVPLAAAVSGKATRTLGVWQGSAAQQAQEMVPDGVRVVVGLSLGQRRAPRRPRPRARRGRADGRRPPGGQGEGWPSW